MTADATSPTLRLKYAQARDEIRTGDLIALRSTRGLWSWAIRTVTRSPYTHTGVAIWIAHRLMVVETRQGPASIVPISQYQADDFDVFTAPIDKTERIYGRDVILNSIGKLITYAWGDILRVVLHELLRVPLPKPSPDQLICSALSESIYRRLGWKPNGMPSIPTPRDLVKALGTPARLEVRRHG